MARRRPGFGIKLSTDERALIDRAARLVGQAPISWGRRDAIWTVAKEIGHESTDMIERVYGHLGAVRHRAKAVEYRVQQHRKVLRGRLALVA